MKLLVGLGNPGKKYEQTWHNLGFLVLDEFQQITKTDKFKTDKKFKAEITQAPFKAEKILLAKPQTFMNNSGQAVSALMNFYKIKPQDLWVINDDIDLPLGNIRISLNASAAGHKGVQSIIKAINSQNFSRFRVGIKSEKPSQMSTEDYVLQKIPLTSKLTVNKVIKKTSRAIEVALNDGIAAAMNQFN